MDSENINSFFNPEQYRQNIVDIVHRDSLGRVIDGKKGSDEITIQDAARIQKHIQSLVESGIDVRFVDNELIFISPEIQKPVVVGGAFDKQCIADYMQSAKEQGYTPTVDPLLSLRLD